MNRATQGHAAINTVARTVAVATRSPSVQCASATSVLSLPQSMSLGHKKLTRNSSSENSPMPTLVCPSILSEHLIGYDPVVSEYLVSGFSRGFRLGCQDITPPNKGYAQNLKSAAQFANIIDGKIHSELEKGRIITSPPRFPNYRLSPLGVVPKRLVASSE